MAPPVNPYKKKPLLLLPPSSGMIIANPYKKQRSNSASGATLTVLTEAPTMTHQDESFVPPSLIVATTRAPPVNPYKKKPLLLLPPSSGMIVGNWSHSVSCAMLQPTQKPHGKSIGVLIAATMEREHLDPRLEGAWITPKKDLFLWSDNANGDGMQSAGNRRRMQLMIGHQWSMLGREADETIIWFQ